ncbi:MAG: UDP-N-acetylglucosamine 1-carboxyvinyltransferase [Deltaproteobacteria bacterium]|nr:UDP-N-acetylglucosamine 1-carboxyvinyltransferase [Deltaproteobacteria bacterium]
MDKIIIEGGYPLKGEVSISGAKNSILPLLFSSLLTDKPCFFDRIPHLRDVATTYKILKSFGVAIDEGEHQSHVQALSIKNPFAHYDLVRTMRASVLALGPLLARCGYAKIALPGGCAIGARPINLHLSALQKLGADIRLEEGYVIATAKKLRGAPIYFETPTVTGTENLMMAAVLADGHTVLDNAAREPEIVDLAKCLKKMGATISGEGTSRIEIEGKPSLSGVHYTVMGDRIEAGTYLVAAAATGGDVTLLGCDPEHVTAILSKLEEMGADIAVSNEFQKIRIQGRDLRNIKLSTEPYPGFPTDMQAQMMVLATRARGTSIIVENIFENRFMHVCELQRMGAKIEIQGHSAVIEGGVSLKGAPVMATDLRASVCLVIGGLMASGTTEINRVYHLDRGYEEIEKKLKGLGAHIERIRD